MKTLQSILFLLFVLACFATNGISTPVAAPVSDDVLLSAIAAVETGNNPSRLGQYGERSQLQILPETWREFSRVPHWQAATNRAETKRVARAYLSVIRHRLRERGLPETPFYMAAGWNAGPGWRHLSRGTISYAKRVANIVEFIEASTPAEEVAAKPEPKAVVATAPTRPVPVISLRDPAPAGPVNLMAQPTRPSGPRLYLLASN